MAKVPTPPPAPLIRSFCPGRDLPSVAKTLYSQHSRLGYGGRLFERHGGWFQLQSVFARADVFGETAPGAAQVPEHFITWPEPGYALADGFDPPGYVGPEDFLLGCQQPGYQSVCERSAVEEPPVPIVHGYRAYFY